MRASDYKIKKIMNAECSLVYKEEQLQKTIQCSKEAFEENETEDFLSYAEFLYQQGKYIHKRWWAMQGMLLLLLWCMLELTESNFYVQRGMGIAAALFAILLLPELWKNRNACALEVEGASYYSLRQIYAARISVFALVDFMLLCAFALPAVLTKRVPAEEMMIQFFLPFLVTCCICFQALYSKRAESEAFALALCGVWCIVWTQMVLNEKVYKAISLPIWCAMTVIAALYLVYCIRRGQSRCEKMWEVHIEWN